MNEKDNSLRLFLAIHVNFQVFYDIHHGVLYVKTQKAECLLCITELRTIT